MTVHRPRVWTSLGAAALLLSACGGEAGETGAAADPAQRVGEGGEAGEAGHGAGGEAGEAGALEAYAGVPAASRTALRLAHLKGFLLAAQAAAPQEGKEAAAVLIGQGVLEVYDPAARELKAAGLDAVALRRAAETGDPADLRAALGSIDAATLRAGGDPVEVVRGMTRIAAGLYRGVIVDGTVDPVEYQHAYGAALAARRAADGHSRLAPARVDLDRLVALWPSPVAPTDPAAAPATQAVLAQASRVELALSGL